MNEQNEQAPQDSQNDNAPAAPTGPMKVFLTSTSETGFADYIELPQGANLGELWAKKMGDKRPNDYVIRVDRAGNETLPASYVLQDGDRVTITPHKFDGATPGFRA